jgi:predicted MFS family arabinose efflux permease
MGVLQSGAGAGMVGGLFLMPLLGQLTDVRTAFLAMAAVSGLALAYGALWLPGDAPRQPSAEPLLRQVAGVARQRRFLYLSSSAFLALFSAYGLTAWLPTYLRNDFQFNGTLAGGVASLINVALIVVSPLAGTFSDRLGTRTLVMLTGFGALVAAFALLIAVPNAFVVAFCAALGGAGLALTLPITTTLTTEVFGIQRAGIAVSLNLAVGQIASTVSGILFGALLDATGSFLPVWSVGLAVAALGALPVLGLRRLETTVGLQAA